MKDVRRCKKGDGKDIFRIVFLPPLTLALIKLVAILQYILVQYVELLFIKMWEE